MEHVITADRGCRSATFCLFLKAKTLPEVPVRVCSQFRRREKARGRGDVVHSLQVRCSMR